MGYYVAALVAGGLVGRIGVALVTAAADWRAALAMLAAFPLAATLAMARWLPAEPAAARASSGAGLRRLLRNRQLFAATVAGSCLFFGFVGAFSFVEYRLEQAPFSLPPALSSAIYVLWLLGAAGPAMGRLAGSVGWRPVAFAGLSLSVAGLGLSLVPSLPALIAGLALFALGNFAGITACQLGVAGSTDRNRGTASALYYSSYYLAGALGGFLPGLAWQAWRWDGVALTSLCVFGIGLAGLALVGSLRPRHLRAAAFAVLP
jgi:YNFM family putative membrane transporter